MQPIPGSTNNQNGRFEFANSTTARTGLAMSDAALGLFTNYAEIGQRAFTQWRALSTDMFVQDSWRPTGKITVEGGLRYVLWPPWHSLTNNIATFNPAYYDKNNTAKVDPVTGVITGGPRYNGILLPGDGFPSDGERSRRLQRSRGQGAVQGRTRGAVEDAEAHLRAPGRRRLRLERQDRVQDERRCVPQPRRR